MSKTPYIVWGRGSDVYGKWHFKNIISSLVFHNAFCVLALTQDMKKEILKHHDIKVKIVPNGIAIEENIGLSKEIIRRQLLLSMQDNVIIYVGRLHAVKGLQYLIQAMKIIVNNSGPNNKLVFIGDGQERRVLENMVAKLGLEQCVSFVGQVDNKQVPVYMVAADIFVLPSLSEGFQMFCWKQWLVACLLLLQE
jgi:glycosyltransferase involved in cell wall biosynthesis